MELPIQLVKTWLELSSSNEPDEQIAHDHAIKMILQYFGNPDIAEDYVEYKKETTHK